MDAVDTTELEQQFKRSVGEKVELVSEGLGRFVVHVPFTFDDGDHYVVLLKRDVDQWVLSDEGHTFMHLSYDIPEFDKGSRRSIVDRLLLATGIEDRQGELRLPIPGRQYGDALFSYLQAITQVTDVSYLSREQVRSTFNEDFQDLVRGAAKNRGREADFHYAHPAHDPERRYPVDAHINGTASRQVIAFGIANDEQCRDATIILNRWESWGERFHPVAVFRDQTEINRIVLARFSDVAEKHFSSLETARDRFEHYLGDLVAG